MPSKAVLLSNGMSFAEIGLAQNFFRAILRAEAVGVVLDAADFALVDVLYRDYCAATSWPIPGDISGFARGVDSRVSKGKVINTECFVVQFADGSEKRFSFLQACSAVANAA